MECIAIQTYIHASAGDAQTDYTINQGTEKHSDINLKLLHILLKPLTLEPVFYTINQGTRKRRDTTLIREIKRYHFQM